MSLEEIFPVVIPAIPVAVLFPPNIQEPAIDPPIPAVVKAKADVKPDKPAPAEYKGEVVEVSTLTDAKDVPIQAPDTTVPAFKTKYGNSNTGKVPRLFLITSISKSDTGTGKKLNYVNYLKTFAPGSINVPNDFKVKVLSGKQAKKMASMFNEHQMITIASGIQPLSMEIGSSPEIFVENKDSAVVPAFEFLGDDKTSRPLQCELGTKPEPCLSYHIDSVQTSLKELLQAARTHNKDAKLSIRTVMEFPPELLQSAKDENVSLGCKIGFNAYTMEGKKINPRELPFRNAGGYIQFNIGEVKQAEAVPLVKALDAILGVCSVSLFANYSNPVRREVYGLAGDYDCGKDGIEYRVLDSTWLSHPLITNLVLDLGRKVVAFSKAGLMANWKVDEAETIEVINTCDAPRARTIMERNKGIILGLLRASYGFNDEVIYNIFFRGMETAIKDPADIVGNWKLDGKWKAHAQSSDCNVADAHATLASGKQV